MTLKRCKNWPNTKGKDSLQTTIFQLWLLFHFLRSVQCTLYHFRWVFEVLAGGESKDVYHSVRTAAVESSRHHLLALFLRFLDYMGPDST